LMAGYFRAIGALHPNPPAGPWAPAAGGPPPTHGGTTGIRVPGTVVLGEG
jgi:hypothetical protein